MKKLLIIVVLAVFASSFTYASVNSYKVNDANIEAMFSNAEEVDFTTLDLTDPFLPDYSGTTDFVGGKEPWAAFAICWFAGYLGVHRLYLGTETIVFIGYLCTGGGFGCLVTVDWVLLLIGAINDDIRKYERNSNLFMWK